MSRKGTPYLDLGQWDEEDTPGAGDKDVAGPGINGDRTKIDTAVGVAHNPDGSHKANTIDGPTLKTTAADGATLEVAGTPLALRVKDGGVGTTQLADDSVTADKLNADTAGAGLTQDAGGALQVNPDGTTIEISGDTIRVKDGGISSAKIADDAITAAKISHDNNRTVETFSCVIKTTVSLDYGTFHGVDLSASYGIPMPHAGSITKVTCIEANGTVSSAVAAYGALPFSQHQRLTVYWTDSDAEVVVKVIGTATQLNTAYGTTPGAPPIFVIIDVEFDDSN